MFFNYCYSDFLEQKILTHSIISMQKFINLPRLYLNDPLQEGSTINLPTDLCHYLTVVLRMKQGNKVRVFNGLSGEHVASIIEAGKKNCSIEVNEAIRSQKKEPALTLVFCPLRKERLHFLVEKAVELGVTELCPIITSRTQYKTFNLERAKKHVIEATEQCERLSLATVHDAVSLPHFLSNWDKSKPVLFCKERAGSHPLAQTLINNAIKEPAFLIGPEGGLTTEETLLLESYKFVRPVSLGLNILRSETAALSALGFWQLYLKAQSYDKAPTTSE